MAVRARPGERYTVRRNLFSFFGTSFQVLNSEGEPVAFCRQKALRLKEDIRLYTDKTRSEELLRLAARQVIDFSATYDVRMPEGDVLCSFRRAGMKSTFLRDSWKVFDAEDVQIATIQERGSFLPFFRRFFGGLAVLFPQTFDVERTQDGTHIATFRQHFNPFVYRMGLAIHTDDVALDELTLIGGVALIAAIEGRRS
ncbi:MAG: hypothetical protein AAGG07_12935 [Planctomycetota bacterium]